MPVRPAIDDLVQIGMEVTEGDGAAATKRVPDLNIDFQYNATFKDIMGSGYAANLGVSPGQEWGLFTGGSQASFNSIVYPLSSGLVKVTPAAGGATSKVWTFNWVDFGANVTQSYCFEKGQSVQADKIAGARFADFAMKLTADEASWTGGGIGQRIQNGITMTPTGVTEVAIVPMVPKTFDVFLDTTWAGAGTTKLLLADEFDWGFRGMFGPKTSINSANVGYAATVKLKPALTATLIIQSDSVQAVQITKMRAGTPFFVQVVATGPLIETSHNYKFTGKFSLVYNGGPRQSVSQGSLVTSFPCAIVHDTTSGNALNIVVENLVSTLA